MVLDHGVITRKFTHIGRFRHIRVSGDGKSSRQLHNPGTCFRGLMTPHTTPGLPHTTTVATTHPWTVPFLAVDFDMGVPAILACESTVAYRARERTFMGMSTQMSDKLMAFGEWVVVATGASLP